MITIDISDGKTSFRLAFSGKFNFITGKLMWAVKMQL